MTRTTLCCTWRTAQDLMAHRMYVFSSVHSPWSESEACKTFLLLETADGSKGSSPSAPPPPPPPHTHICTVYGKSCHHINLGMLHCEGWGGQGANRVQMTVPSCRFRQASELLIKCCGCIKQSPQLSLVHHITCCAGCPESDVIVVCVCRTPGAGTGPPSAPCQWHLRFPLPLQPHPHSFRPR